MHEKSRGHNDMKATIDAENRRIALARAVKNYGMAMAISVVVIILHMLLGSAL